MKTFKLADFWLQLVIITGSIIAAAANAFDFFYTYFITGGYQLISMLAHEKENLFTGKGTARRYYHNLSYTLVGLMLLTPLVQITGVVFFVLLYAAPFMAIYYTWLCWRETFVYMKRPLSILK